MHRRAPVQKAGEICRRSARSSTGKPWSFLSGMLTDILPFSGNFRLLPSKQDTQS